MSYRRTYVNREKDREWMLKIIIKASRKNALAMYWLEFNWNHIHKLFCCIIKYFIKHNIVVLSCKTDEHGASIIMMQFNILPDFFMSDKDHNKVITAINTCHASSDSIEVEKKTPEMRYFFGDFFSIFIIIIVIIFVNEKSMWN